MREEVPITIAAGFRKIFLEPVSRRPVLRGRIPTRSNDERLRKYANPCRHHGPLLEFETLLIRRVRISDPPSHELRRGRQLTTDN